MLDDGLGVVFCWAGRQYITISKPEFVYYTDDIPHFVVSAVELPDVSLPDYQFVPEYFVKFVLKMSVLESDKFIWSDLFRRYSLCVDSSNIDFLRDAYLEEPQTMQPYSFSVSVGYIRERLLI